MRGAQLLDRCRETWVAVGGPGWCGCVPVAEAVWQGPTTRPHDLDRVSCAACGLMVTWWTPSSELRAGVFVFSRSFRGFTDSPQRVRAVQPGEIVEVEFAADGDAVTAVSACVTAGRLVDAIWLPWEAWQRMVAVNGWLDLWGALAPEWPAGAGAELAGVIVRVAAASR